jgi:hypothetical protein
VPEQKLDLLEIASGLAAELRTGPAKIVSTKALDSDFLCGLLDHGPAAQSLNASPFSFPDFEMERSRRPSSISAAVIQMSIPCFTQIGTATVLTRPTLPRRSAITHRPYRIWMSSIYMGQFLAPQRTADQKG